MLVANLQTQNAQHYLNKRGNILNITLSLIYNVNSHWLENVKHKPEWDNVNSIDNKNMKKL